MLSATVYQPGCCLLSKCAGMAVPAGECALYANGNGTTGPLPRIHIRQWRRNSLPQTNDVYYVFAFVYVHAE